MFINVLSRHRIKKNSFLKTFLCSAGVGRTGTFIALDYLLEQANNEGSIDIFDCVEKMRDARPNMVNTRVGLITIMHFKAWLIRLQIT